MVYRRLPNESEYSGTRRLSQRQKRPVELNPYENTYCRTWGTKKRRRKTQESKTSQKSSKATEKNDKNSSNDRNWRFIIDLSFLPTKEDDILVTVSSDSDQRQLKVTGKTKTISTVNDIEINSSHEWSKVIKIPQNLNEQSLKARVIDTTLQITANLQDKPKRIQIIIQHI